jgi:hypothetical protein
MGAANGTEYFPASLEELSDVLLIPLTGHASQQRRARQGFSSIGVFGGILSDMSCC